MARARAAEFTVEQQLCFALHSATRAITCQYRQGLQAIGLTYSQYVVMLVLWEHQAVTLGFLCEQLHLDSGTLSPLLKRLERQGLVTRQRRVQDERILEIACTPAGAALRAQARDVQARVEQATGLSRAELASLRAQLQLLASRLRESPQMGARRGAELGAQAG